MRSVRTLVVSPGPWLPVLVLALLLVDSPGGLDFHFHPGWGFDSYEITVPRKLRFQGGEQGATKRMSYLLQVRGRKHVLHLWPKRLLLPRHLQVFSYTERGELVEDYPYVPTDCSYVGVVEGAGDSEATLSTCAGGLRGILRIDAKYYQMEPLRGSSGFEHALYLLKDDWGFRGRICGSSGDGTEEQTAPPAVAARYGEFTSGPSMHQKYFELGMVFDHERFLFSNSNLTDITNDAILLTSIMDTYFQELRTRIMLRALEVWSESDRVNVDFPTLRQALGQFLLYQKNTLSRQFKVDWSQLFVKRNYSDAVAWSRGAVCAPRHAGSVCVFPDAGVLGPATWSAHNIGHSLGLAHDGPGCRCRGGRRGCVMGAGRFGFSNCSVVRFFNRVGRPEASCLDNTPGAEHAADAGGAAVQRCGNKVVEGGEQCDCGSLEDCRGDPCCAPGCRLRPGANCSAGLCCHRCRFRPSGYTCRARETECDLAEYCDGASGLCPGDAYMQDGTPCRHSARCFRKGCPSARVQCQGLFGPAARSAPTQCYQAVNAIGDQYGNCGAVGAGSYRKCARRDAACGRVQCVNVGALPALPALPAHTRVVSTRLSDAENLVCWGVGYRLSLAPVGVPDPGLVSDGSPCGEGGICVNATCLNASVLRFDCAPGKCSHRGLCNNHRHCHCEYGWAPPLCEEQGYGGSVDSGPPGRTRAEGVPAAMPVMALALSRLGLLAVSVAAVFFRRLIRSAFGP